MEQRENPIVNRLNKTKVEKFPDLREEKEARLSELRKRDRESLQVKVSTALVQPTPLVCEKACILIPKFWVSNMALRAAFDIDAFHGANVSISSQLRDCVFYD